MGVLINPERPGRVREFRDAKRFADALPSNTTVKVVIQVRERTSAPWNDLVEYWSGLWRPDIPVPTRNDLIAAGRSVGARYVRHVVRTNV